MFFNFKSDPIDNETRGSKELRVPRLRVMSNFGDGNCGAGELYTRVRAKFRGDATLPSRRVSSKFRACVCIPPARNRHRELHDPQILNAQFPAVKYFLENIMEMHST